MKAIKTLLSYIGRYKCLVFLSIILGLVSSLTALLVPIAFGQAIDAIVVTVTDDNATLLASNHLQGLVKYVVIALGWVAFTALMQWLMGIINNKITFEITKDIRADVFRKLQRVSIGYLDKNPTGELVSRMIADIDTLSEGLLLGFTQGFTGLITIVGTIYYMWTMSHVVTIVVVCATPLSIVLANFVATRTHNMFVKQSAIRAKQTALINEMLENQNTVRNFGYEDVAIDRFEELNNELAGCSLKALFYSSTVNPGTRFVNAIVYALVALVGAGRVLGGHITIGSLTALLNYATQYTKPFNDVSSVITELQNALSCAQKVFSVLEQDDEADNELSANAEDINDTSVTNGKADDFKVIDGNVEVRNVSFAYSKDKPLIENFNIKVKAGQTVAIVGPTGCGKTTLINLLMRFYDVDEGTILIDGTDIASLYRQNVRDNLGMVLQDTWIKTGTVLENICVGRSDAGREEAILAAKNAHAHSFIKRLPGGYDTLLGESGVELSVGQRQLLCIARVMLALPPVLILDEATSNIDTRTEIKIQKAFHTLMDGRTTFIVAHRLSTIMDADIIIAMKDGHIIEQGSHGELMEKGGFYSELFNAQFA